MTRKNMTGKRIVMAVVGIILLFMAAAVFYGEGITGAAVLNTGAIISANTTLDLGENVTSLRVTGSVSGSGQIALYLGERVVFDTATLDTALADYCLETCEIALGAGSLRAVVDGDVLLIVTAFNYTSEETVVTIPDETSDEINQTIGIGNETDETNQTLNLTNETNQINQTDGETDDEMDETPGTDTAQETFNAIENLNFEPLFLAQPSPANTSEVLIQADVTSCQTISSSGTYTLTQDISATGSCMFIQTEHVTLDCRGYAITYGTVDSNSVIGIWAEDSPSQAMNNITIKNCRIFAGDRSNTQQTAIYAENISSSTIFNNTIAANGTDESMGIWLYNSSSVNITDNAVTTQSVGGSSSYGIYFQMTPNSFAVNNSVRTNGTTINYAMRITSTSPYEVIYNNNVTTNGDTYGIGIYAESNGNNISSNRINTNGFNEQNWGLYVSGSNNRIDSNTIRTDGSFRNYGIYLFDSENNTVHSNTINTRGGAGGGNRNYGILAERSSNNTMWLNTIATYGNFSNYGVFLYNYSSSNNISWNTIYTYSNGSTGSSFGVYLLEYAQSNAVASNLIVTNGTFREDGIIITTLATANNISGNQIIVRSFDESYGIYLHTGADNNVFARNNITLNDTISSAGIRIENSSHNTFFLENINVTSARSVEIETQHQRGGQTLNNTLTNVTFIRTNFTVDFIVYNGTRIKSMNSSEAPTGPNRQTALGKYVNITNTTIWSWVFVNISYLDVEVGATPIMNESLLRVWKYNSTGPWTNASFFTVNDVVPALNFVYANITNMSTESVFGVFGKVETTLDVSSLLPVVNTVINKSTVIEIAANITDDRVVQNVTANVTLPNGTQVRLFLGNASTHATKYNISFAATDLIGQYNVTFWANDSSGNINATERTNFTVVNRIPIVTTAILNTTDVSLNDTTVNLTLYLNVTDDDRHSVKNITNWLINAVSWTRLLMPFERINGTAYDNAYDYSGYGNNGSVNGATWNGTAGFDGRGAYKFDGINDYIQINDSDSIDLTNGFTISAWIKPDAFSKNNRKIVSKAESNNSLAVIGLSTADITFYGNDANDSSGRAVGSGDFNNDGIDDVIIGASSAEGAGGTTNGEGATYIKYGPFNGSAVLNLSNANVTFFGVDASDASGTAVGSGDFNNDGIDDVIIGASSAEGAGGTTNGEGETYILYGSFNGSAVLSLSNANVTFFGVDASDSSGSAVGSGDFNNDGIDDVIIGAYQAEGEGQSEPTDGGDIYIMYGPFNGSAVLDLSNANVTFSGGSTDKSGSGVGSGDFNNDGIDDLILGAYLAEGAGGSGTNAGETYIIYGPFSGSAVLSPANANVTFFGTALSDSLGRAVGSGDFNNDGIDDAIIGAYQAEGAGGSPGGAGETYIIYGPFSGSAVLSPANANVTFFGITANDLSGSAVGSGDFNNDGIDDVIMGAYQAEGAGGTTNLEGETYIMYGPHQRNINYDIDVKKNESLVFSVGIESIIVPNSIKLQKYTHIAAVYSPTQLKIYINGILNSTKTVSTTPILNTLPLTIGAFAGTSAFFNGTIDELAVYNRSLSAEQISAIFNNQSVLVANETEGGQNWYSVATPNDGYDDGAPVQSNTVRIRDTSLPTWSANITNASVVYARDEVNFSVYWSDTSVLSVCGFQIANDTINYVNVSHKSCAAAAFNISFISEINATRSQVVRYLFWANDTDNNFNFTTEFTLHVSNSLPLATVSLDQSGAAAGSQPNVTLTITSSDVDNDPITKAIVWYRNSTPIMVLNMPFEKINNTDVNNTWDYAGLNNKGSEFGSIQWKANGGYDRNASYWFNGTTGFINISENSSFDFGSTTDFTLIARINTSWFRTAQTIIFQGDRATEQPSYGLSINPLTGYLNASIDDGTNDVSVLGTTNLTNGSWHLVAATFDRDGILHVYTDGVQEGSISISSVGSVNNNNYLAIGSMLDSSTGPGIFFNGSIDEVQIFNRSLSAEQIKYIFNNITKLAPNESIDNDVWYAIVTPNDGVVDGEPIQSNSITLSNAPTANANITNTTGAKRFESVNFSIQWTDANGLSYCGFEIANDTITLIDTTPKICSGTTVNISFVVQLNATRAQAVKYRFWANDTADALGYSDIMTIHMADTAPRVDFANANSTSITVNDTDANISVIINVTDIDFDSSLRNITNWFIDGVPWTRLIMPFEKFNDTTTRDYSGYGNNGSVNGATWNGTAGFDGRGAYKFDGINDSIMINDSDSIDLTNGFTISAWIKPDAFSKNSKKIVSKAESNNSQAVIGLSTADIKFYGIDTSDLSGIAAGSGDFNNDGIDDVIIGASGAEGAGGSPSAAGETYIIYGPINGSVLLSLANANVTFFGVDASDASGTAVGSGDFNNDGIDDVIIGASGAEGAGGTTDAEGETYILYGPFNGSAVLSLANANVTFFGINTNDLSGSAVGSGDFNNDGIVDVIIGASGAEGAGGSPGTAGETYILYGPFNGSAVLALSNANVTFFGMNASDSAGFAVGSGDFNNDGIDDAIIGATNAEGAGGSATGAGETYIKYGPFNGSAVLALSNANVTFFGIDGSDSSGQSVGSGDFNNDGIDDVIIGANGADGPGGNPNFAGDSYIMYGPFNGSAVLALSNANVTFSGINTNDHLGTAVDSGDFNNDGIDDVIIGARFAEGAGGTTNGEGETYIRYGPHQRNINYDIDVKKNESLVFSVGIESIIVPNSIKLQKYTHIAAVYSPTQLKIYINGILNSTKTVSTTPIPNTLPLTIGAFAGTSAFFNGTIDELASYNRSLSAEQIAAIFNNQSVLVANETEKHEVWFAEVTAHDGFENGAPVRSNNITIREAIKPNVTSITPTPNSIIPAGKFIAIGATVIDNDVLLDVQANVTYSNGSYFNYTLNNGSGYASTFNRSFFVPEVYDAYNITIIATDRDGNINSTQTTTFNVTYFDADNDGLPDNVNDTVVGNITSVVSSGVTNLNISIDGNTNLSRLVDGGYRHFAFYDGGTLLFNFTHNMSASSRLALSNVSITIASNSVIINMSGLLARNETKTVYIADNSFTALCVKDEQINSVDAISSDCDGTNETLFTQCLGNSTGVKNNTIRCIDEGSRIQFENMSHSGIRGTVASGEGGGGGGGSGGGSSSAGSSPSFGSGSAGGGASGSAGAAAPAASGGTSTPFSARAVGGSEIAQAVKAEQTEQEARPIRDIEVEFTNEGSETLTNLALGVGATEKIQRVTGDITRLEARTQEFERFVHYLLDHIRPKSGSAGNAVTGSAVAEVHAPEITGDIIASAKDQSEQLKEFLDGLKVTINVTFDDPEEINEQIAQVKVTIDIFVVRLDDSYNKGTLYDQENADALAETSSAILSKVEAIKKEITSELDSLIIAQTENYNPIYPTKIVAMNAGPFRVTKKAVNPEIITAQLLGNVVIDKIAPGETFKQKLQVKLPFTALEKVPVDVVYSTFGQEIARETVTFDLPKKVAASTIYAGDGVLDIYAIISDAPGQSNSTYDAAIDKIFSQELTIEVVINKNNGAHTAAVEWFGPYPLKSSESILLAQQFAYDKSFIDDYEIEFIFRRGASIVARQKHALYLKQSCIEQCSEESCANACGSKGSILFVVIRAIAAVVILAALFMMYAVGCGFNSSGPQLLELPGNIYRKIVSEEKVIDYDREERMIEKELRELNIPKQKIMTVRKPTLLKMKKPKPSPYAKHWNKKKEGIKNYSREEKGIERKIEQMKRKSMMQVENKNTGVSKPRTPIKINMKKPKPSPFAERWNKEKETPSDYDSEEDVITREIEQMKSDTFVMQKLRKQSQPSQLKIDLKKPKPSPYAKHWNKHNEISKKYSKEEKRLDKEIEKLKRNKSNS